MRHRFGTLLWFPSSTERLELGCTLLVRTTAYANIVQLTGSFGPLRTAWHVVQPRMGCAGNLEVHTPLEP